MNKKQRDRPENINHGATYGNRRLSIPSHSVIKGGREGCKEREREREKNGEQRQRKGTITLSKKKEAHKVEEGETGGDCVKKQQITMGQKLKLTDISMYCNQCRAYNHIITVTAFLYIVFFNRWRLLLES